MIKKIVFAIYLLVASFLPATETTIPKDTIAIVCLAGGRGERFTTPQAVYAQNHICPKPLCTLPTGESFLEILANNASQISSKIFVSTNIPEIKSISHAQADITKETRKKIQTKSTTLEFTYKENIGLGSAYAAYGEEIQRTITDDTNVQYICIVPGDTPYATDPSLLHHILSIHIEQEQLWKKAGKRPGCTVISTDYIDLKSGKIVPTKTNNMGCLARDCKGNFLGMVEAQFLQLNPIPARFPIGTNSKNQQLYIYPDTDSKETDEQFIKRIKSSTEVCTGILIFSKPAYDFINLAYFPEKNGERDAFSGPIAQLIEHNFGIHAHNIHKQWILEGANTRTHLRTLNTQRSENIKHQLAQRGVDVSNVSYISTSNGFRIEDIEANARLSGNIFLSGRIRINKNTQLSNVTLYGYTNLKKTMLIENSIIENSYISASNISQATIHSSEIFSTTINHGAPIQEKTVVLNFFKKRISPSKQAQGIYETWVDTKKKLTEDHLQILEQVYSATILPDSCIYVCDDIFSYFETLAQTIYAVCKGDSFTEKIQYFIKNPGSFFAQQHENGTPLYTTRDLPVLLGEKFKTYEFYIGANTLFGGIVGIAGKKTKIESDAHVINSLLIDGTVSEFSHINGKYIENNKTYSDVCFQTFANLYPISNQLPYFENGYLLQALAEFFEIISKIPLLNENLENIITLINRWKFQDFKDYAETVSQNELINIVHKDYQKNMYTFYDYCSERNVNPLHVLEHTIATKICQPEQNHHTYVHALKKSAKFLLGTTNIRTVTEQQMNAELWKMARILYHSPISSLYNPYQTLQNKIHHDISQTITNFYNNLNSLPPKQLISMLAIANNFEMSFNDSYEQKIFGTLEHLHNLDTVPIAIDARELFIKKIWNIPQKMAIFTDNMGEIEFDLLYVLAQARVYQQLDPENLSKWTIALIPKSLPIHIDAYYQAIVSLIFTDARFQELKSLLQSNQFIIFKRGPCLQGIHFPHLSREIIQYLDLVQEEDGTVISLGMGNSETIKGLAINHFNIFTVKNRRMESLSGVPKGSYVVSYIPKQYKPRFHTNIGTETLAGITLWEQIKQRMIDAHISIATDENTCPNKHLAKTDSSTCLNIITPEAMWLYILPHIALFEHLSPHYYPMLIERGANIIQVPWQTLIDMRYQTKKDLISQILIKKIASIDKSTDPDYFASLINSFLTKDECLHYISTQECNEIEQIISQLDDVKQKQIKINLEKFGIKTIDALKKMHRGECISIFASIGLDEQWKMSQIRKNFINKQWTLNKEDIDGLRLINFECWKQLINTWQQQQTIINREGEKTLRDHYDNIMFKNTVKITEKMYKNATHTARPILNILLKNTEFSNFLKKNKIFCIDDAIAMGRTAVTAELLFRSFFEDAQWLFCSIVSEDGYANICDVFASPGPERLPENSPNITPILASEISYLPSTNIPIYTTYSCAETLKALEKAYTTSQYNEDELKKQLEEYNHTLINIIEKYRDTIINALKKTSLSEKETQAITKTYINNNIELIISTIKMNLRNSEKREIMYTYVHDYLSPQPWLGNEMNIHKITIRIISDLTQTIKTNNYPLYMKLINQDRTIKTYEELCIARQWLQDYQEYVTRQQNGLKFIEQNRDIQECIAKYCQYGICLNKNY